MSCRQMAFVPIPYEGIKRNIEKQRNRMADQRAREDLRDKRTALAKRKGFSSGCTIKWRKRDVTRILKKVSLDGFLIIEGSINREHPRDWDVVR